MAKWYLLLRFILETTDLLIEKFRIRDGKLMSKEHFTNLAESFVNLGSDAATFTLIEMSENKTNNFDCCEFFAVSNGNFVVQDFSRDFLLGNFQQTKFRAFYTDEIKISKNPMVCKKCLHNELLMQQLSGILRISSFPFFNLNLNKSQRTVVLPIQKDEIKGIRIGENKYYLIGIFGHSIKLIPLQAITRMIIFTNYILDEANAELLDLENIDGAPSIFSAPMTLFSIKNLDSVHQFLLKRKVQAHVDSVTNKQVSHPELKHTMIIRPVPHSSPRRFELHFIHEFRSPYVKYKFLDDDKVYSSQLAKAN